MGRRRSCHEEDERLEDEYQEQEDEEEEEEALSLCDLPLNENPQQPLILNETPSAVVRTEDFDFNHWPPPPPMCAADDVFFRGHMLPLRLSFGSENSHNHFLSKNLSTRSESMDHNMMRFRNGSTSSSSSSSRNHYSRSSSISNNSISIPTSSKPNRAQKNVFHSHPSPTPQIRSFSTSSHRNRRSSRWDFFRLGLLRTPRMELHDLKTRTNTTPTTTVPKTTGSFLGVVSCKKSVDTITSPPPPPPPRRNEIEKEKLKEKVLNSVEIRQKETRVSHRRTFEWLKQLSHANFGDQQQ